MRGEKKSTVGPCYIGLIRTLEFDLYIRFTFIERQVLLNEIILGLKDIDLYIRVTFISATFISGSWTVVGEA